MNKKIDSKTKYVALIIYIILVGVFYFFTLSDGAKSSKESRFVTDVLLWFLRLITLKKVQFDYEVLHHITRKLVGHFGYNLILGVTGYFAVYGFKGLGKIALIISLLLGLFIASTGELLQFIPANRGPSFVDIMINFSGEVVGIVTTFLIMFIIIKNRNKKIQNEN